MDNLSPRVLRLERLINQLNATLLAQAQRLSAQEQQMWQAFTALGGSQGGSGGALIPASITSSVTAGTDASPTTFTAVLEIASGAGFTTSGASSVTGYNRAPGIAFTASSGTPKVAWLTRLDTGNYYLVAADC